MAARHLGLDLGGTNIKATVLESADPEATATPIHNQVVPTNAERGPDEVSLALIALGNAIQGDFDGITTVGIGVPGLFDAETGTIGLFPNLPGDWSGYNLRGALESGLDLEVAMLNDARAFTLAEGTIGAGRGAKAMLGITLGTGIGGGLMIDGRLHLGAFGTAGEFGHQTVDPNGPICGCGNHGCLEAMARADVIAREAGVADARRLFANIAADDTDAIEALERASYLMAIAIANTVALVGIDTVVVGGGVMSAGDAVLDPLRRAVSKRVTLVDAGDIRIVAAELGPMAGAIGAALAGKG